MKSGEEIYEFGSFRLEVRERRLLRSGQPLYLRTKVFDTLRVLVQNHGKLVSKDELMKAVWPDAVVEEGNVAHNLTVLRRTLGDRKTGRQHIETVPGQGYRFIASVTPVAENAHDAAPERQVTLERPPESWEERLESARAALVSKSAPSAADFRSVGHIVGRDHELAELYSGLESACRGQAWILCIAGEPGIGKSTVVERFLAEQGLSDL